MRNLKKQNTHSKNNTNFLDAWFQTCETFLFRPFSRHNLPMAPILALAISELTHGSKVIFMKGIDYFLVIGSNRLLSRQS